MSASTIDIDALFQADEKRVRGSARVAKYSPTQPRDDRGRWVDAGSARDSYGGGHAPPSDGPPLHDLLAEGGWFPDDVYTSPQHYTHGGGFGPGGGGHYDRESIEVVQSVRGNPDAPVTIYRAVPPNVDRINTGDWVAVSRSYAEQHAEGNQTEVYDPDREWVLNEGQPDEVRGKGEWVPGPPWKVIEMTVPARLIRNGGNDIIEWGYWGPSQVRKYSPTQPRDDQGQWTSGGSSSSVPSGTASLLDATKARLERRFPRAYVTLQGGNPNLGIPDAGVEDAVLDGITSAVDRVLAKFPQIGREVALVRLHARSYNASMGEVVVTTVNNEYGEPVTGLGLELHAEKLSKHAYDNLVEDVRLGAWSSNSVDTEAPGFEGYDEKYERRGNTFDLSSHAAFVDSVVTHELGHMVHMLSTAKGAGTSVVDGMAQNQAVWDDVMGSDPFNSLKDPDNAALGEYAVQANDDIFHHGVEMANNYPLPSAYARTNRAELFAEAFTVRHGSSGVGTIGGRSLSPELVEIMTKIESDLTTDA